MGLTSLQAFMDSSEWLQGTIEEESSGMESSRPLIIEKKARPPQHEEGVKCPRCESTHTKFCYYNNYSLTQPRYLCKSCRRYWTKGGTLRNVPVGGGCRKNKQKLIPTKKPNQSLLNINHNNNNNHHLNSFPQIYHLNNILGMTHGTNTNTNLFMESSRNYDFMGNNGELGLCSDPYGMTSQLDGTNFMDSRSCQTQSYCPNYDANDDVKPNTKLLSLEWQDHGYSETGKLDTYGYYSNNLGSWSGILINNSGCSFSRCLSDDGLSSSK